MKMLIANLMALGVLGAATAVSAQTDNQRDHRQDERAQPNKPVHLNAEQAQRAHMVQDRAAAQARGAGPGYIARQKQTDLRKEQAFDQRRGPGQGPGMQQRQQWQRNVQATRRFRAGGYRAPPGFAYRRWGYGQRLPGVYFGQNYWLTNWFAYGLFSPPAGLVWVRYGPDAILVDRFTGDIVQVRYGVFY